MFDKIVDTYEQNCKIMLSFVQPEPARKALSAVLDANLEFVRDVVPAFNKLSETLIGITVKNVQ